MPLIEDLYAKQRARQVELLPFFYSTSFANSVMIAGATIVQTIPIQSDSHFIVRYINVTAYITSGTQIVATASAPLLINFFDTGSGRTLQDNPQPVQNLCGGQAAPGGAGNLPFILPEPWMIRAGGVAQITLINIGGSTFTRVDVSLVGFKAFRFGASAPADM